MMSIKDESILQSVKMLLGINKEDTDFDQELIAHINSVFMILRRLAVGDDKKPFYIQDETATWGDFDSKIDEILGIKSYMYAKVRLIFDPPQTSAHIQALQEIVKEFEFTMMIQRDYMNEGEVL